MSTATGRRVTIAATVLALSAACGGGEAVSGTMDDRSATDDPVATTTTTTTTTSTTTTTTTTSSTPQTTTAPVTTQRPSTTAPAPERITRAEAETLAETGRVAAETNDPAMLVAALGETGAFVAVDGTSYSGEAAIRFFGDTFALGNVYRTVSELAATPEGFLTVVERVHFTGRIEAVGLEYRKNAAGDFEILQVDPVLVLGDRDAAESGLDVDEAEAILRQVVGVHEDRDWGRAVDALGPDGAWVEPTFEVRADQLPEFFQSYVDIVRIEITGPGVPSSGGFVFPVTDHLRDGSTSDYFMIVTRNEAGALRLIFQPGLPVGASTSSTTEPAP